MSNIKVEVEKIANLLEITPETIHYLERLDEEELAQLRLYIIETIELRRNEIWKRVAKVAAFMPNFMSAKVAETVLGPSITANLSYYLPIKDVVSIMKHLSTPFMAHTAEHMIPEMSKELLKELPLDALKKLVVQLIRNQKHIVISGFVEFTPIDKVLQLVPVLPTTKDLLQISHYITNKEVSAALFSSFDTQKMKDVITTAVQEHMYQQILDTYPYLDEHTMKRLAVLVVSDPKLKDIFKL